MKKIGLILLVFFFCGSMTFAAGNSQQAASDGTKTIRIIWWGNQNRHDITTEVCNMYAAAHPGVKFEPEFVDYSGYYDKLAVQAASNTMPDIAQNVYENIATHVSKNMLVDLMPYKKSNVLNLDDVPESIWSAGLLGDKLYGIVLGVNAACMVFDKGITDKAGVTIRDGMTWGDFAQAAKTINERLGVKSVLPHQGEMGVNLWLRSMGLTLFGDGKMGYPDYRDTLGYYQLYVDALRDGYLVDARIWVERDHSVTTQRPIFDAMVWNDFATSNYSNLNTVPGRPFSMVQYPARADAKMPGNYMRPATLFCVTTSSKYPEECASFLSFFTNSIEANKILKGERGVPIAAKIVAMLTETLDPTSKANFNYIAASPPYCSPISPPDPPGSPEVKVLHNSINEQLMYGRLTADEAAKRFFDEGNAILARYK